MLLYCSSVVIVYHVNGNTCSVIFVTSDIETYEYRKRKFCDPYSDNFQFRKCLAR
jgi:hypothetical protein